MKRVSRRNCLRSPAKKQRFFGAPEAGVPGLAAEIPTEKVMPVRKKTKHAGTKSAEVSALYIQHLLSAGEFALLNRR